MQLRQTLIVFTIATAAFLPAVRNGLFADDVLLIDARMAQRKNPIAYFRESYWGDLHHSGLYRPLSLAALSVERRAFGRNPVPYRIVNLAVHGLCSVLVLLALRRLASKRVAFASALLFAVHPIHAEAVTTIYGQEDLLAAVFFLGAVVVFLRRLRVGALVSVLYLLSTLSKEQGVFFPLLLPVLRRYANVPASDESVRFRDNDAVLLLPLGIYALLRIASLGLEIVPTGAASVGYGYPPWARINLAIVTVGTYLRLLVLPWGQTTYYGHLRDGIFGSPRPEALTLFAAVMLFRFLQPFVGRQLVVPAYAFLAVTLLPVANLVPVGVVVAERCLYLPALAVCLLISAVVIRAADAGASMRIAAMSVVLAVSIILSVRVAIRWRTPLRHWETTASDHPRSAAAHARFALLLLDESAAPIANEDDPRIRRAEQEIDRALEINPRLPDAWEARVVLALRRGDCLGATAAREQMFALRPGNEQIENAQVACQ